MKIKKLQFAAAAFASVLLVSGAALAAGAVEAKPAPDQRAELVLLEGERHLVLQEMRNFLATLQTITEAVLRKDMKEVARAARLMGSGAANEIPPETVAKLPEPFKMFAGGVHTTFDVMAMDAETLGDPTHTVGQVSEMLQKCNACHGIYQIKVDNNTGGKR